MRSWPIPLASGAAGRSADKPTTAAHLCSSDLSVGMTERLTKTLASSDVIGFARLTGDRNPIPLSKHFAAETPFRTRIAHGLYTASLISRGARHAAPRDPVRSTFRRP